MNPTLNVPLVERIIQQLIDHPETHDQGSFGKRDACGTTHCTAGHAAHLTPGVVITWVDDRPWLMGLVVMPDGRHLTPAEAGAEMLGINYFAAMDPDTGLFMDMGDTHHIVGRLKELINDAQSEVTA